MSTKISHLTGNDRFSIINGVQDWCDAAEWYEPGYTRRQSIRAAFILIRNHYNLSRDVNLLGDPQAPISDALYMLDEDAYQMREAAESRPGPSALGLSPSQV